MLGAWTMNTFLLVRTSATVYTNTTPCSCASWHMAREQQRTVSTQLKPFAHAMEGPTRSLLGPRRWSPAPQRHVPTLFVPNSPDS